jgi:hypothetical protein
VSDYFKASRDLNNSWVQFVLRGLNLGLAFMDMAQATGIQKSVRRNHRNARKVYDIPVRRLENLKPGAPQQQAIDDKMALLKARLQAVGQQF